MTNVRFGCEDLRHFFEELSIEFEKRSEPASLFVVGGAAMALLYDAERLTRDLDSVFFPAPAVREVAAIIADKHGLDEDWINDGVKGFLPSLPDEGEIVFETPWLRVRVASAPYMLAMKLYSGRAESDLHDAVTLWRRVGFTSVDDGLALLEDAYSSRLLTAKHMHTTALVASTAGTHQDWHLDSRTSTPLPASPPWTQEMS